MIKRSYFGTDGDRATYGSDTMNEAFAWRLGAAAAKFAKSRPDFQSDRVFIGRDTRASGPALERALAAGLRSEGLTPISLDVVPTPAVSLLTRMEGASLGVVITASHNPASDNGIKFFGANGIKFTDADELNIERLLLGDAPIEELTVECHPKPLERYLELATAQLPAQSLAGWKVVLDTANGAGCVSSRTALLELGAELTLIGNAPDGTNINADVGSQHPEKMCEAVKAVGARIGIAHDGDADRCILCDEKGEVLDGDEVLTLLAVHALAQGKLVKDLLVVTVQSNLGVDAAVRAAGGRVSRSDVGDRYVIERMLSEGATLGGESSGHVICAEVSPTGDGLVAALKVVGVMLSTGKPLSELRRSLKKFPQRTSALYVQEKKPISALDRVNAAIAEVEASLGSEGRVLVRYSGTEPKIRLLVEGPTDERVEACLAQLDAAVRADLDVI